MQRKDGKRKHGFSRTLDIEPAMSWAEIADELDLNSREHARIIAQRAITKIKRALRGRHDISPETIRELLATEPRQTKEPDAAATRVHWFG